MLTFECLTPRTPRREDRSEEKKCDAFCFYSPRPGYRPEEKTLHARDEIISQRKTSQVSYGSSLDSDSEAEDERVQARPSNGAGRARPSLKRQVSRTITRVGQDVEVTVKIVRLSAFDVKARKVHVDFVVMLDWIDLYLFEVEAAQVDWDITFVPKIVLHNSVSELTADSSDPYVFDPSKGWARVSARYRGELLVEDLDMRAYPFDSQMLHIQLKALKWGDRKTSLSGPSLRTTENENYRQGHLFDPNVNQLDEWQIVGRPGGKPSSDGVRYDIQMLVRRQCNVALWSLFFPVLLLNALSFVVFPVSVEDLVGRLQITLMLLLTVVTFKISIGDSIPMQPYLTDLDKYFIYSVFVPFSNSAEHVAMASLWKSAPSQMFTWTPGHFATSGPDMAWRIESLWIVLQAACFILVHCWLWDKWRAAKAVHLGRDKPSSK